MAEHLKLGLGGLHDFAFAPSGLPAYGGEPHGATIFLRLKAQ